MSTLQTFKGGVHPPEKKITATKIVKKIEFPDLFYVPMLQHIGVPAQCVVAKNDHVQRGQLIGAAVAGKVSATIHAPTSGKVKDITLHPHPLGKDMECVVIEPDGEDAWWDDIKEIDNPMELSGEEIIERIKNGGIVGMGGATFPMHIKLSPPAGTTIDTLIINGAECEPMLTSDHRLMVEEAQKVVQGSLLVGKALGVQNIIIGVEENKPDAIAELSKVAQHSHVSVVACRVKYPQGAEKQLIQVITGREVPERKLPMAVGVVVQNVASVAAAYDAVKYGRPLIERITTVTGNGVKNPDNILTRIGMPIYHLVEQLGGYGSEAAMLIMGGPMMGQTMITDAVPVIKGTGGVVILNRDEMKPTEYDPCIRCGKCVAACPMRRSPHQISMAVELGLLDHEVITQTHMDSLECVECGSCAFACPARRPLTEFLKRAKAEVFSVQAKEKAKKGN